MRLTSRNTGNTRIITRRGTNRLLSTNLTPPGWTPATEADLGFWIDISNSGTITKDGSNLVSKVTNVNSLYGDFNAVGTARPTWTINLQNGMPGLVFNGTSNFLTGPDALTAAAIGTAFWGFVVFKGVSQGAGNFNGLWSLPVNSTNAGPNYFRKLTFLISEGVATYSTAYIGINGTAGTGGSGAVNGIINTSVNYTDGNCNILVFSYSGGDEALPASWTEYKNNSLIALSAGGGGQTSSKTSFFGSFDGSINYKGNLFEAALFTSSPLTPAKLHTILNYSNAKWGTPAPILGIRKRFTSWIKKKLGT